MNSGMLIDSWNEVKAQVKTYDGVDPSQVDAFFQRLQPQAMSEGFIMLTADNDFIKNWIERHYSDLIRQALLDIYQVPFSVVIEVDTTFQDTQAQAVTTQTAPAASAYATQQGAQSRFQENPLTQTSSEISRHQIPSDAHESARRLYEPHGERFSGTAVGNDSNRPNEVDDRLATEPDRASDSPATSVSVAQLSDSPAANALAHQNADSPRHAVASGTDDTPTSTLTFENFVIGDSNRMAYSMAVGVAEMPGRTPLNPLFIYGKSGLGKTHLMRAIQNYICETQPHLKTVYVDSAELLSDYMDASAAHDKEKSSYKNFKNHYEEADVLLIDDIQYLQGKKQTLDIVFQIFNKLTNQGRQIVLSADRAPKNIDIDERYHSRFNQGGTIDIQPPEIETKLGIVKSYIREYRDNEGLEYFNVPEDIQIYIAENSSSNIRELKSAVTKVIYQMTYFNQPDLTIDNVRVLLENHFSGGASKNLTVEDIQREVETFFKVKHADLVSKKRARNITYPRQVAIYLCRQMLDLPFGDIGKKFNRDHSTAMHSVAQVEEKMRNSREIQEEIETLKQIIREI